MNTLALALLISGTALAEEPEAVETETESVERERVKLPPAPTSMGALTPERLMALRTYKSQRLQVRAETEYRGSSVATFTSMSYGYPQGVGTGVVVTDNLSTFRTWGVYRGPQRLSTPDFLQLAGATQQRDDVVREINRLQRTAKGWYVVAGTGVAGVLTGLIGMATAEEMNTYGTFNLVSLGGTIVTIGGLFGASFPGSKAQRLYKYPGNTLSSDEANDLAYAANERLRQELEIAPNEAWLLDLGATD